jgi:endonuclease G, mitochondrial
LEELISQVMDTRWNKSDNFMKLNTSLHVIFLIFILSGLSTCKKQELIDDNPIQGSLQPVSAGEIIEHTYSLAYSEVHEASLWVFYRLSSDHINGDAERKDNFREDPKVSTGSATLEDYKGSGYDRGHLAPAAAFKHNQLAMDETFYMSNMSSQHPLFNNGIWKSLESQIREWVLSEGELYVVSGAIYSDPLGSIGENNVTVPSRFYKVVYDGQEKMIGFIMPNEKCDEDVEFYAVSVDSVETVTGIDFFSGVVDEMEVEMEAEVDFSSWVF